MSGAQMFDPALVTDAAARHALPAALIGAIIEQESGGNPWAYNAEPRYQWFWDVRRNRAFRFLLPGEISSEAPPLDFGCLAGDRDQEWWAQQASWGLMQIMGAVARERGCVAPYLTALCAPDVGIEFGCRHLAWLKARHFATHGWTGVIAAYNAGSPGRPGEPVSNQGYVDSVRRRWGPTALA